MASYQTLVKRLMTETPNNMLVIECAEFAHSKKQEPLNTFFVSTVITHPAILRDWEAHLVENIDDLKSHLEPPKKPVSNRELDDMFAEVYNKSFITIAPAENPDTLHTFKIRDRNLREVVRLGTFKDDADTKAILARECQKTLDAHPELRLNSYMAQNDIVMDGNFARRIREQAFINDKVERSQLPAIFAQPNDDCYCLNRRTVLEADGEFPRIRAFLDRINDPDALAAWLYGIATNRYLGRQVLYLQGAGADGKGTFFKAFGEAIFKASFKSFQSGNLKSAAGSFLIGMLEDARFALVPDANDPAILLREDYKSLTSKDQVLINKKNQKMYTGYLQTDCAILSNFDPIIKADRHSTSRILYLRIAPMPEGTGLDANYVEYYKEELPAFLYYARECYERLCRNDTEITLNAVAQECINEIIAQNNEEFVSIFERCFEARTNAKLPAAEFVDILTDERLNKHQIADFRHWLKTAFGVETAKGAKGVRIYRGIQRKGSGAIEESILDV